MGGRPHFELALCAVLGLGGLLVAFTPVWPPGQASAATGYRVAAHLSPCTLASSSLEASGASAPGFPVSTAQPGPPRGLIAAQQYVPGQEMFTPSRMVFANRAIAGVQVIGTWEDLSPRLGSFNWAPLDQVFAQADASHKFVVLTLVPGFGAPGWALADPVEWACFDRQYGDDAHLPAPLPPGRFAAQENGLTASGQGGRVFTLVESHHGTIVVGFQLTTSATTNPTVEAGPGYPAAERTDSLDVLTSALSRGLVAHADFLEVYEPDVVNPAMQCVLQRVEAHWAPAPTPACLPSSKPPAPHCHGSACT